MVSVVIPCCNASRYMERLAEIASEIFAITSETLLVDVCSGDDTCRHVVLFGLPIVKTPHSMGSGGASNFSVKFV